MTNLHFTFEIAVYSSILNEKKNVENTTQNLWETHNKWDSDGYLALDNYVANNINRNKI